MNTLENVGRPLGDSKQLGRNRNTDRLMLYYGGGSQHTESFRMIY